MKWVCSVCGYIYDDAKQTLPFDKLPDGWVCPVCSAPKSAFAAEKSDDAPRSARRNLELTEDMKRLDAGEMAAICSNLARGCEKQYLAEAASLWRELAAYFEAVTPAVENAEIDRLSALIAQDLDENYDALRATAVENGDRGTQRICVWGSKVTNMLKSLVERCRQEGAAFVENTQVWVCTACGFVYVGDHAPELCPVCKVPAWKFEKVEGRADA